jgi:Cu/Ag efflux pump CusA
MLQYRLLALAVVPVGMVGGVIALSFRHMPVGRGAAAGLSFIASLAFAQGWIVLSGISDASKACSRLRAACFQGAHAKFKAVLLVGICVVVGFIPMAVVSAPSGAQAQFATSAIGGVVFSTPGALIALPALTLWFGD